MIKDNMQYELNQQRQQALQHEAEQHRLAQKPGQRGTWRRWLPKLTFSLRQAPEKPALVNSGVLVPGGITPQ